MKIEYFNLFTHFIFTTLHREPLIEKKFRERIEKYITGIVNNNSSQLYAIYANPEHVHFLVSRAPDMDDESLAETIANSSWKFINENKLCKFQFQWQQTCSAFSVSKGDVDKVCKYILNQPEHHKHQTYGEEYDTFLKFYQETLNRNKK
jgi:REP element-mobilizing transposase RayT